MIIEINPDTFDQHLTEPCIVDFYTSTCPACVQYAPIFERAAAQYDSIPFLKINIDGDFTLAQRYGIEYVPTTIKFVGGEPVSRAIGGMSLAQIGEMVDAK